MLICLTLFLVSTVIFLITTILPGTAATAMLGPYATPEKVKILEVQLGLEKPVLVRYVSWLWKLVQGDWGVSLFSGEPVLDLVSRRLLPSMVIVALSIVMTVAVAIPLGVEAAVNRDRWPDLISTTVAFLGLSIPYFVWGLIFILVFALGLHLLPTSGYVDITTDPLGGLRYAFLPSLSLTVVYVAHITRQTRSSMIDVLTSDYIRTAKAKGLSERRILYVHALRNALLPALTVIAIDVGYAFGGIVILEEVFAYPGIGRLAYSSIIHRDIPVIQICVIVIAAIFVIANLTADLLYAYLNPRIRYT